MRMMNRGCLLEARRMLVVSMHNALIAKSHENASRCIYTKCIIEREKKNTKTMTTTARRTTTTKIIINKRNRARDPKLQASERVPKMAKALRDAHEKLLQLKINNVAYKFIEGKGE